MAVAELSAAKNVPFLLDFHPLKVSASLWRAWYYGETCSNITATDRLPIMANLQSRSRCHSAFAPILQSVFQASPWNLLLLKQEALKVKTNHTRLQRINSIQFHERQVCGRHAGQFTVLMSGLNRKQEFQRLPLTTSVLNQMSASENNIVQTGDRRFSFVSLSYPHLQQIHCKATDMNSESLCGCQTDLKYHGGRKLGVIDFRKRRQRKWTDHSGTISQECRHLCWWYWLSNCSWKKDV